ncbi:MAG: efflux RND transporter periplasmic adaptor subunit [Acidobacteria bacterium]|nr:MAG: efflux RND transporter periplasmic adaptor subunit [Acidobacteriota bacterium]
MPASKSFFRRFVTILGITLLAVFVVAGSGYLYFQTVGSTSAAETQTAQSDDASDDQTDDQDAESSDEKDGEGEDGEDEEKETAIPVSVHEIARGSISSYITATSNLVAENEVQVLAEAEGRVEELHVEEGQPVTKGQLLAALARDDEQIAYEKAEVRLANAKSAFDRAQRLGNEGLVTEEDLDKATMEHRVAQQELAEAEWKLNKTEIRAPFDGRITARNITLGQHIRLGDELFTVTDFDPLISRIYLPEKDIMGLEEGRSVRITLKSDDSVEFDGRIRQISPVVDTSTGTVKLTLEAIQPPLGVRPGGFVTIAIVRETHSDAILLPREAVIRELQSAHVFVIKDDQTAERRDITLGMEEDDHLEVTSGLESGDVVVVAGQGGLKDGKTIKVIPDSDSTQQASDLSDSDESDDSANG